MIDLKDLAQADIPHRLPIGGDIVFICNPMTLQSYQIARAAARHRLTALEESLEHCKSAGLAKDDLPDLESDIVREGVFEEFLAVELAKAHVTSWEGVYLEGEIAAVTEDAIEKVIQHPIIGQLFPKRLMGQYREFLEAKKDSGIVASGSLSPASVPDTAKVASLKDCLVPPDAEALLETSAQT